MEISQWLELFTLLHPFTVVVKNLYISRRAELRIAPALQGLSGKRATEVLPALQDISYRDSSHRGLFWRPLDRSSLQDSFPIAP